MAVSYPEVNNRTYSFASVEIDIDGTIYTAVKSINYSDSLEPGELRGTAVHALARTAGEYKAEASFEVSLAEAKLIREKVGDGYMLKSFPITVTFTEDNEETHKHELVGCRMKKNDNSNQSGSDPTMEKIDLHVMYIKRDGLLPMQLVRPGGNS
jgi:hypothetical protein